MAVAVDPAAGVEQEIWRAVHRAGAEHGLDAPEMGVLRAWTAKRMRDHRYAAIQAGEPPVMRATFMDAIAHAARTVSEGKLPN